MRQTSERFTSALPPSDRLTDEQKELLSYFSKVWQSFKVY